jgi:hypothetical protein
MQRVTGTKPKTAQDAALADAARAAPPKKDTEENRAHFLEAHAESGRQMRAFIREHYGDAE